MNIKTFILVLAAGGFFLSACQKNTDIFVPDPGQLNGADTSWHAAVTITMPVSVLKNNLLLQPYYDSIEVNASTATVLSSSGLLISFPPNCCVNDSGQIITGRVDVELIAVKKKGDMIRLDKPSTYNDSLLITAGDIFIKLKKNGQPVLLAPNVRINIRYVDLPISQQMNFFVGEVTNSGNFNWLPNPDPGNNTIAFSPQAYEISTNRLNWISLAHQYNLSTGSQVNVMADIAAYFTNFNTFAFTVFKDFRSVVSMRGDINTRKFITGKLPVGKQITVVVISKQGNDYYLGFETAVTQIPTGTNLSQHVRVVPIKKSLPEIISYLNSL